MDEMNGSAFPTTIALAALIATGCAQAYDKAKCTEMLTGTWDYSSLRATGSDSGTVATIALEAPDKATVSLDNVVSGAVTRVSMLEGNWSAEAGANEWACSLILTVGGNPPSKRHLEIVTANEFIIDTTHYWRVQSK